MSTSEANSNQQAKKKFSIMNLIGAVIGCGLILAGVAAICFLSSYIPQSDGRDNSTPLPMEGIGLKIDDVQVRWQKAENERIALRAAIHPIAKIRLGDFKENAQLVLEFVNSSDARVGDLIHVEIKNGAFTPRDSESVKAAGKELSVILASGFMGDDEYKLHELHEYEQLWKLRVQQRDPETGHLIHLGHACIKFMEM